VVVVRARIPQHLYSILKDLNINFSELIRTSLLESIICDDGAPETLRNIVVQYLNEEKEKLLKEIHSIKSQIETLNLRLNKLNTRLNEVERLLNSKKSYKVWTYFSMKHEQIQRDIERSFADIDYLLSRDDPDLKSKILARIDAIAQSNNVTANVVLHLFWEKFKDKYPNLEAILF